MQPDEERILSADGSFPPEDDTFERQPADEGIDDPDTERPSDLAEDPDDEDYYAEPL